MDVTNIIRDADERARTQGKAGAALLITTVRSPDETQNSLKSVSPIILRMEELLQTADQRWKPAMMEIINKGTNIRSTIAKREKAGGLTPLEY
jgi:hypothetical protein